jgi:hypothetical protein
LHPGDARCVDSTASSFEPLALRLGYDVAVVEAPM